MAAASAAQVTDITGIDVTGYKVQIEARQIKHILSEHGVNGSTDNSMKDPESIAKLEYALNEPDDIRAGGKTSAYVSSINGRNRRADTVIYEKKLGNESYYVVQAVPETKKKRCT